jgi:hypothetical protein
MQPGSASNPLKLAFESAQTNNGQAGKKVSLLPETV